MNEISIQNDFDYSVVGTETASKLKALSNQLDGIYQNYSIAVGEVLYQAQQELSNYGDGTFGKWIESKGISRRNGYNYINSFKFVQNLHETQKEIFDTSPKSLQFEMSKPSADSKLNQKVFDGDITTHKQYKELERQLKLAEADKERLRQQNENLAEQALKQEVIEKEVVIEKVPDDYNYFKSNYEASKGVQEFYKKQNEELREEMKELEKIIKTQRANSASQSELQKLEEKKAILNSEIESLNKIAKFQEVVETFIADNASLSYTKDFENLYSNRELTLSLLDTFNRLEKWIDDTKSLLPDGNIIEGE